MGSLFRQPGGGRRIDPLALARMRRVGPDSNTKKCPHFAAGRNRDSKETGGWAIGNNHIQIGGLTMSRTTMVLLASPGTFTGPDKVSDRERIGLPWSQVRLLV
jgi:hypothetical protein